MRAIRNGWAVLAALLVVALVVRLAVLPIPGHDGDVRVMARWAERMAEVGPWAFYEGSGSVYPALLYVLWPLGLVLGTDALLGAIKGLSIPFDLGIGVLLFATCRPSLGTGRALLVAGIYLLNPAVILAGPIWGQVDSAGTLAFVAALVASAAGRNGWAAALGVTAALFKPQFGIVLFPVVVFAVIRAVAGRRLRPVLSAVGGGLAAYLLIGGPLLLHPPRYLGLLVETATRHELASVHAFNPWGMLFGFEAPDPAIALPAALLLLAGIAASLLRLRRGQGLIDLLATGALLAMALYFLPTRVHERYLFPAMALLAPLAPLGLTLGFAYAGLTAGFAASLLWVLHVTTSFDLPQPLGSALASDAGTWAVGLVLIGSAVVAVAGLVRRVRPPAPPDRGP